MPHPRPRHILPLLLKKLSFNPVLAIQGARQIGKSFLVRELLKKSLPQLEYATLDRVSTLDFANSNPETFLAEHDQAHPFVIDEAQKSPRIFDAIKYEVDALRKPGRFLLLGSTEFSKLSLIRESLTGRMSRIRLYSMNLAETLELPANPSVSPALLQKPARVTRAQWIRHLTHGGMPGIFAVRDRSEQASLMTDWLELTTQRDASLFPKVKIDSALCLRVLEKIATLEEPNAGNIAKSLKRDLRRVKTHLGVLETLFAIHSLEPHPMGTGKTLYFLCDVGLAQALNASFERRIHTWVLHEQLSQRAYRDDRDHRLSYYRTPKGSLIHLIIEDRKGEVSAIKILSDEKILERDMEILKAFQNKIAPKKARLFALGSQNMSFAKEKIEVFAWESLA